MLKIRLQRTGKKNQPRFRVVLINSKLAPKSGSFLEVLGYYDPINKKTDLKNKKIQDLIKNGAVLSKTVSELYKKSLKDSVN